MDKIEEINNKILLLRKRFRSSPMEEIYENNSCQSIIQIFEKKFGKKTSGISMNRSLNQRNDEHKKEYSFII